jgi:cell division initiation protein
MDRFSTAFKGYKKEEVNKFVSDCIKQVEGMLESLKSKDVEIEKLKNELVKYKTIEDSLNKAILMAEDTSSQMRRMASEEGTRIINEARRNASRIVNEALMQAEKTQNENLALKRNIITFKKRLRTILESQLDLVDEIDHLD